MLPEELTFFFHVVAYISLVVSCLTSGLKLYAWIIKMKLKQAKRKKDGKQR